jgi:hypothetical protein
LPDCIWFAHSLGSFSTEMGGPHDVRFPPDSDEIPDIPDRQLRAELRHRGCKPIKRESRPKAALDSNPMIVDQAAIKVGFDLRR